jgi:hypothetical protein
MFPRLHKLQQYGYKKILPNNIAVMRSLFLAILVIVIKCNIILDVMILYSIFYYFHMEILVGIKEYKESKKESSIHLLRLNN